jgi:hypothetical protein
MMVWGANKGPKVLTSGFNDPGIEKQLKLTNNHLWDEDTLFGNVVASNREYFFNNPRMYMIHGDGVTPETFKNDKYLPKFYQNIATAGDKDGKEFVAMIQSKQYPFYAIQGHIEKNQWEKRYVDGTINQDRNTIDAIENMIQGFVEENRRKRLMPQLSLQAVQGPQEYQNSYSIQYK